MWLSSPGARARHQVWAAAKAARPAGGKGEAVSRRRFAEGTEVQVSKTKTELDELLARHGATQRTVGEDDEQGRAVVVFGMAGRHVRLEIALAPDGLPDPTKQTYEQKAECPRGWSSWTVGGRKEWVTQRREQFAREAWRRVLLVTKAKLELVAEGCSTLEREFLADVLLPDGRTVHEALREGLAKSYLDGSLPPLLPARGET